MKDKTIKTFFNKIPMKYSMGANKADEKLTDDDRQQLIILCQNLKSKDCISDTFKLGGSVISKIYTSQKFYAVPSMIRKVMYLLVYRAYEFSDVKKSKNLYLLRKYSYQKDLMTNVNNGFNNLGKTTKWSEKLWNADKWDMHPLDDYCNNVFEMLIKENNEKIYKAPKVVMGYAGKKMGYMVLC